MNIPIFLAAGMAAELVLALIRPLRGATRGLVCWSVSAVVLSVAAGILCAASLALSLFGERDTAALLLVPPTAAALRQTLWFMKSAGAEHPATQREKLAERISCGKYKL